LRPLVIRFGRDLCCDLNFAERREWLVTNGIGGYASGTIGGLLTRRYHGLLVAALDPPVQRMLLVPKIDETVTYLARSYALGTNRWADGTVDPAGYANIESFHLDGTAPVWRFACADAIVEKRVWMVHGQNTTMVRYRLERGTASVELACKVFVDSRDHHGSSRAENGTPSVTQVARGIRFSAGGEPASGSILCDPATWTLEGTWYRGFDLAQERERGLDDRDDHFCAAIARLALAPGDECTFELRAGDDGGANPFASWPAFSDREAELVNSWREAAGKAAEGAPAWVERLALAASQFIVDRPGGKTVIAGYPWFTDWGRDTMTALPGLALSTGRPHVAKSILQTFARYVDAGMIPNRFPDAGAAPEYNTADASLWFFLALRAYQASTGDEALVRDLYPKLAEIIDFHVRGTRFGIRRDPSDGLLAAGAAGVQLTWMDAKVGDWVVTPRIGKPVEINALWYSALRAMSGFAVTAGKARDEYDRLAESARAGFARFWNVRTGYCFDVVDGPDGDDAALRPNQIIAASLPDCPLTQEQVRGIVEACARELLTSYGLRSLAPSDPAYRGRYEGDPGTRDGAYHQGTVWAWLLGPFALAHFRAYGDAASAQEFLAPMEDALVAYGVGSLGEIFDGDAPFRPRGCPAQAWSVAETLACWTILRNEELQCATAR
jgi:predicted glycogen debranching enzyme